MDYPLAIAELALLVRRQLVPRFALALGGNGGGVQVLDVTQARGRTFDRLFVLGLVRDVFPRSVREDPLLPDALRERVCEVLPDIPVKKLGYDEERFLFAELLASAPSVDALLAARSRRWSAVLPLEPGRAAAVGRRLRAAVACEGIARVRPRRSAGGRDGS